MITEDGNDFVNEDGDTRILGEIEPDLRAYDPDRYLLAMMAEPQDRRILLVLFGLNLELARIPEKVTETVLGQMRYQSWRDALARARKGENPVMPLASLVHRQGLEADLVDALIDAREAVMLLEGPPESHDQVLERARRTGGTLGELTLRAVAPENASVDSLSEAAQHAGTAYAMIGVARATRVDHLPPHADRSDAVRTLCDLARQEVNQCRLRLSGTAIPKRLFPAFAAATLAELQADALSRHGYDPMDARTQYRGVVATLRLAWRRWRNTP